MAPLILNLGPRWRWVISLTPRLLYHQEKKPFSTQWIWGCAGTGTSLHILVMLDIGPKRWYKWNTEFNQKILCHLIMMDVCLNTSVFTHIAMGYQKQYTALCKRSTGEITVNTNRYSYKEIAETTVYTLTTHMNTIHSPFLITDKIQRPKVVMTLLGS